MKRFRPSFLLGVLFLAGTASAQSDEQSFLVIVMDGLRPDYVTAELMPNLHALGERGVVFEDHHSVYPTVTRVNSASLSTGAYPETHGLMGNSVYFPELEPGKALTTSDAKNLIAIGEATGGKLLTATTLGEVLEAKGRSLLALSSGSSGSAMLMNHKLTGGGVVNVSMILPTENDGRVVKAIGAAPPESVPAGPRNAWVVDAYVELALGAERAAVTYMWLTDPDHTAHEAGIGAPLSMEAVRGVDDDLGRILRAHEELGIADRVNIMVTSDHGFSTHTGGFNLAELLREHDLYEGVTLAGGAIYVENSPLEQVRNIVELLQKTEWVGAIFTRGEQDGTHEGWVAGTLSFRVAHWRHARSADILVSPNWDDEPNEFGYKGRTTAGGVAGHGSTSPYDIHNTLVAAGPAFKKGLRSGVATSNTDIAPTILYVLGIDAPESMYGRAIREALVDGPDPDEVRVMTGSSVTKTPTYALEVSESIVDDRRYFNYARAWR